MGITYYKRYYHYNRLAMNIIKFLSRFLCQLSISNFAYHANF